MKPTITCKFQLLAHECIGSEVYRAHVIRTSDHPRLGVAHGGVTETSRVLRIDFEMGILETENAYYKFK